MTSSWTELLFTTCLVFVALTPILESFSASVSLQKQDLAPSMNNLASSIDLDSHVEKSSKSRTKRRVLKISKNLFNKLIKNQEQLEHEADEEALLSLPSSVQGMNLDQDQVSNYDEQLGNSNLIENVKKFDTNDEEEEPMSIYVPAYKEEMGNKIVTFLPATVHSSAFWEDEDEEEIVPYYDCPLYRNSNPDGSAIVKADPFDCSCGYYCDWGVHKVQCCSWPLLWNQDIKNCDWYFNVRCRTYNSLQH
ncbi:unnamed protein product [Orchesella dallaii]|uniref:Chitin-binding type-2 domain-containing protein n=1 Tax=Orchesella dallaii TaxID=48710 RepID=A0ABP1Q8C7_9HEXA